MWKRWALRSFLNLLVSAVSLMLAGKEFQAAGPAWLKQRSPNFVRVQLCRVWRSRQCWRTSDRVYSWIQRLTAQSQPSTVVHVQCGSGASMHTTCTWFCIPQVASSAAEALMSHDHGSQDWAPDGQLHFVHVEVVRWCCVVDRPTVSYSSLVATAQTRISAEMWQRIWSAVVGAVGRSSCLQSV